MVPFIWNVDSVGELGSKHEWMSVFHHAGAYPVAGWQAYHLRSY